jgi:cytochrome c oxidase assembly factor CtaG
MTTAEYLRTAWQWYPAVVVGCAALLVGYFAAQRGRRRAGFWRAAAFVAGVVVLLVSLVSPLDDLGDEYLFSAHMLQHLLLLQIVPPLLLLGLSPVMMEAVLRLPWAAAIERALNRLPVAFALAVVTVYAWHIPALYNAALESETIHTAEHLLFLVTATIFWWPVLSPIPERRTTALRATVYLFAMMAATAALGIFLTFTPPGLYPAYVHSTGDPAVVALVRGGWGLTPAADQQAGGLLMWVAGGLIYFLAFVGVLTHWYGTPEDEGGEFV